MITATQDHQEEDSGHSPTVTAVMQIHEKEEKDSPAGEAVTLIDREAESYPPEARSGNCLFKNTERGKPQNSTPQGPRRLCEIFLPSVYQTSLRLATPRSYSHVSCGYVTARMWLEEQRH